MNSIGLEQHFFGRTEYLDLLKRRVVSLKDGYRQNLAFLGNRYVGKSRLLQYFLANLDDGQVVPVYLDLENKDLGYLVSKFTGSLLYNFTKTQRLPLYDDVKLLMAGLKDVLPHTIDVIGKVQGDFLKGRVSDCFSGLLTLPEIFTNETGKCCILIFDEFQDLDFMGIPDVFQYLGKKIMTQKRCQYIVTSSYPSAAKKILTEKLSLLFGNFEVIALDAFDVTTSQKFVEYNLQEKRIGAQLKSFLADFTGGHPLYLNLICQEMIALSAIHHQNEIYMPLLAQAVENTIFDRWGVISRHFELIIQELCQGKGNHMIASILMSLSNGRHKMEEFVEDIGIKRAQITQKMHRLMDLGIVVRNGRFYYLKDKLFKYWVKYVYQKRLREVELAPDKRRRQFKEEFNRCVENFKAAARKDFPSRIMELLHCFDNESFDLNGRKYRLPVFRDLEPTKVRNEKGVCLDVIRASTDEAVWLVMMKKEPLGEHEINAVLSEIKKSERKPSRCVLISLAEMEENARLKALQERFWIWSEGELKTLLALFDKPYFL